MCGTIIRVTAVVLVILMALGVVSALITVVERGAVTHGVTEVDG